jgi:hypothetical protein
MGCISCRDYDNVSCPDIVSSSCVIWQGDAYEDLEICIGDKLTSVVTVILDQITELLKGRGIILEDLTLSDCEYISDLLGAEEKNLLNVLDVYKQAICELKEDVDGHQETLDSFTSIELYDLLCLEPEDPCGDPLTFQTLIQAIITKLCALSTQFESIAETILDAIEEGAGNFLLGGAVTSCGGNGIVASGSGASAVLTFQALVPPNCPILYTGSTAFFDVNGVGLPSTAYCGWYLCNGNNGTPNSSTLPQNLAGNLKYIIRFT